MTNKNNTSNVLAVLLLFAVIIGVGFYSYNKVTSGYDVTLNYDFSDLAFENNLTFNEDDELIIDVLDYTYFNNMTFSTNKENLEFNISEIKDFKLTLEIEDLSQNSNISENAFIVTYGFDYNNTQEGDWLQNYFEITFNEFDSSIGEELNNIYDSETRELITFNSTIKIELMVSNVDNYIIYRVSDDTGLNYIYGRTLEEVFNNDGLSLDNLDLEIGLNDEFANPNFKINTFKLEYNKIN